MNMFEHFLEENNYERDLEFQLCDLKLAFYAGKKLQWKPSDEQMDVLFKYSEQNNCDGSVLTSLYNDLKKLKGE